MPWLRNSAWAARFSIARPALAVIERHAVDRDSGRETVPPPSRNGKCRTGPGKRHRHARDGPRRMLDRASAARRRDQPLRKIVARIAPRCRCRWRSPASARASCRRPGCATPLSVHGAVVVSAAPRSGVAISSSCARALPVERRLEALADRWARETASGQLKHRGMGIDDHMPPPLRCRQSRRSGREDRRHAPPAQSRHARNFACTCSRHGSLHGVRASRAIDACPSIRRVGATSRSRSRMSFCGSNPVSGSNASARR